MGSHATPAISLFFAAMHARNRLWPVPTFVVAVLACGDPSGVTLAGRYDLRGINDDQLPATLLRTSDREIEVLSGSVVLGEDSTFVDERSYRTSLSGSLSVLTADTIRGSFSVVGDKISFSPTIGEGYEMVWAGTVLTFYAEGVAYHYRR
jgi:hypothetical protein